MSKLLLHPPEGTTSFTFNAGCGQAHEFDGAPIDCEKCVEHVATLPPDERVAMHLRGPSPVQGATPEERAAYAQAYLRDRERFSWRLVAASDPAPDPQAEENARLKARVKELENAGTPDLATENEKLKARIAELEAAAKGSAPATRKGSAKG